MYLPKTRARMASIIQRIEAAEERTKRSQCSTMESTARLEKEFNLRKLWKQFKSKCAKISIVNVQKFHKKMCTKFIGKCAIIS